MNSRLRCALVVGIAALCALTACETKTVPPDAPPADLAMAPIVDQARNPFPDAPLLGAQLDRVGRPLINLALTNLFQIVPGEVNVEVSRQLYNDDGDESRWAAQYGHRQLAFNLAVYDAMDQVCGNQPLADLAAADDTRYDPLALVLADDRLYVNLDVTTCKKYLAVELGETDCGGRAPLYDVATATYSLLITGARTGVDGGVAVKAQGTPSSTDFPFLARPNTQ